MTKNKRQWWAFPWGYRESLSVSLGLLICGLFFDYLGLKSISFAFPNNIILLIILGVVILFLSVRYRKSGISKWLSSVQASIVAILLFVGFSVVIALIPDGVQNDFIPGGVTRSWMYHFVTLYMFLVLGVTTCRKFVHFKSKDIPFVLNHMGLWIVLFFASVSSYNIEILQMYVNEDQTVWYAFDEDKEKMELPFAIKLKDFDIDEYTPKLALISNENGKIVKGAVRHLEKGDSCVLKGIPVKMKELYTESVNYSGVFRHSNMPGAPASALIASNGEEQWVSCGSHVFPSKLFRLNEQYSLAMLSPEPKRYFSEVTVYEKDGGISNYTLEVNKPLNVKGWYVYQKSYDKAMGKWSQLSVIELVKDSYLWVVYVGCIMMIFGSIIIIFKGKTHG